MMKRVVKLKKDCDRRLSRRSLTMPNYCALTLAILAWIPAELGYAQVRSQFAQHVTEISTPADGKAGPHGGLMRRIQPWKIETVVDESGFRIHLYDSEGGDLPTQQTRGIALLKFPNDSKRYRYDLLPNGRGTLSAIANLSRLQGQQLSIQVQLFDVPLKTHHAAGHATGQVRYRESLYYAPSQKMLIAQAIKEHQLCPVSGELLGSRGNPLSVTVSNTSFLVCCKTCQATVEETPVKYASGKPTILISTSTPSDADLIAQQKLCPVMQEPLGGMGTPIKATVGKNPIFLCCRGCVRKLTANPGKYFAMLKKTQPLNPTSKF